MRSNNLSEPLAQHDYRAIDVDMPGDWATNEEYTIQITRERTVTGRKPCIARVYDAPADALELPRCTCLATAVSDDHGEATRLAIEGAIERDAP